VVFLFFTHTEVFLSLVFVKISLFDSNRRATFVSLQRMISIINIPWFQSTICSGLAKGGGTCYSFVHHWDGDFVRCACHVHKNRILDMHCESRVGVSLIMGQLQIPTCKWGGVIYPPIKTYFSVNHLQVLSFFIFSLVSPYPVDHHA
jgi:hypothetical protein